MKDKPPKRQLHLISSPEPITDWSCVVCDCGEVMRFPEVAFIWDSQGMNEQAELKSTMRVCDKAAAALTCGGGYVYGVVPKLEEAA